MVSAPLAHFLQLVSIGATAMFIALLVAYELAPSKARREALKDYMPYFMALGMIILLGAVTHK